VSAEYFLRNKLHNVTQSVLLVAGMAALLALLGWVIAGPLGIMWALLLGAIILFFAPRISPYWLLRLYRAQPMTPSNASIVVEISDDLARRAGLHETPLLYYIPSRTLNAFTVGNGDDAAIALTDGLLRHLTLRELGSVIAHEISHIKHNDVGIMSLADAMSRLTSLLSMVGQMLLVINLPLILISGAAIPWLAVVILVFSPALSTLLQLALSRAREFDADLGAVMLTGDPAGLARALEKLEGVPRYAWGWLPVPRTRDAQPSMLRSHPATHERIRRLHTMEHSRLQQDRFLENGVRVEWPEIRRRPRRHITGLWH
jgi:heat shock protein HtpX